MLLQSEVEIGEEETAPDLSERLSELGASLLVEALEGLAGGRLSAEPQDSSRATYAPVLKKEDGHVDWRWPAQEIHCRARGFLPWPGAHTTFRGGALQVWRCAVASGVEGEPGTLHPNGRRLLVSCGGGTALELREVQLAGKKRISADAFLNGQRVVENEVLGEGAP
jgi:methionyl-tRNA formyltransferase